MLEKSMLVYWSYASATPRHSRRAPLFERGSQAGASPSRGSPSLYINMAGRVASPSTTESSAPAAKRQKTAPKSGAAALPFAAGLLDPSNISKLRAEHEQSTPYKHAVVQQLFEPDFLKAARSEIVEQLSFREKETDICECHVQSLSLSRVLTRSLAPQIE